MTKEERREYEREWRKNHPNYFKEYRKRHQKQEKPSLFQKIINFFKGKQDESKRIFHG